MLDISIDLDELVAGSDPALLAADAALTPAGAILVTRSMRDLAANTAEPSASLAERFARTLPFHGHREGAGLLFDLRTQTADGEHAICAYDDHEKGPSEQPPDPREIVPFGFWLFDRVAELCAVVEPQLVGLSR